jgi:hypothetical protein
MDINIAPIDVGSISVFISSAMASQVAVYATKHDQDMTDAVDALLGMALARLGASSAGGHKRWAGVSPEARSVAARHAVTARWDQYRTQTDQGRTTTRTDSSDVEKSQ